MNLVEIRKKVQELVRIIKESIPQPIQQYVVNWAILVSQIVNTLVGGSPYEMLSARCWRQREISPWRELCYFLDNWAWPLCNWRHDGMTHCESCYYDERLRYSKCKRSP